MFMIIVAHSCVRTPFGSAKSLWLTPPPIFKGFNSPLPQLLDNNKKQFLFIFYGY